MRDEEPGQLCQVSCIKKEAFGGLVYSCSGGLFIHTHDPRACLPRPLPYRSLAIVLECITACAGGRPIELLRKASFHLSR